MCRGGIHSLLIILWLLCVGCKAIQCPPNSFSFQMNMVSKADSTSCSISWNLFIIYDNQTQMNLFSDYYDSRVGLTKQSFEYCVFKQQVVLDIDFSGECYQQGFIDVSFKSVFLESLPFESHPIQATYHFERMIVSSDYSIDWNIEDVYHLHSYLLYTEMNCCILFGAKELCLQKNHEWFQPPDIVSSIRIVNRNRAQLMMFPLYHHPSIPYSYRSLNADLSRSLVKDDQLCQIDFSFRDRMEWVNGVILSNPVSQLHSFYILTSLGDRFSYLDHIEVKDSSFVKFGYFSREPVTNIRLVTNWIQYCRRKDMGITLVSFNQLKPSGELRFFHHETLRLVLPSASVYHYQIIPQELSSKKKTSRDVTVFYEVNPQTGLLTNKKAVSASLQLLGHYKQHNPVLSFYAIQPSSVTIPLTIQYKDCSQLSLYRLVVEITSISPVYSRYHLQSSQMSLLFIENSRGSRSISRFFCSMENELSFTSLDGTTGMVSLFIGDLCLSSYSFDSTRSHIRLLLSLVQSRDYKNQEALSHRDYRFNSGRLNNDLLDLLVISKEVQSIIFNEQLLFVDSLPHSSFVRLFSPVHNEKSIQKLLIQYKKEDPMMSVHAALYKEFYFNSHIISTSFYNDTLFVTPLHHEMLCINALRFSPVPALPSFSVERFYKGEWQVIGSMNMGNQLPPVVLLLQLSNMDMTSQYRVRFSEELLRFNDSFQFGYVTPSIWDHQDLFTPGFRLIVVKDCFNWIPLNEEYSTQPMSAVVLRYSMFYDWVNDVVFGTASGLVDQSFESKLVDASILSSRIQLVECTSSQVILTLQAEEILTDVEIRDTNDDELLFFIPHSLQLRTISICLQRNAFFQISSRKGMALEVTGEAVHTYLFISPNPLSFSTFYSSVPITEFASSSLLQWHSVSADLVFPSSFVYYRIPLKGESTFVHIQVKDKKAVIVELMLKEKIVMEKEVFEQDILVTNSPLIVKLRLLQESTIDSILLVYTKEHVPIQQVKMLSSKDLFFNPYRFTHAVFHQFLLHPLSLRYDYSSIVYLLNLSFQYQLKNASSLLFHVYSGCHNVSTVLHNAILSNSIDSHWVDFSFTLSTPVYLTSLSFSFDFIPFSHSPNVQLLLRNLTLNADQHIDTSIHPEVLKEESKPLFEKLQTIAKEKESIIPQETKPKRLYCKEESLMSVVWPRTPAVTHVRRSCEAGGMLHRFCDSTGQWSTIDGKCKKTVKTEDLLHQSFTRSSSSQPVKPLSPPLQTPPLRFCEKEVVDGLVFPSTMSNKTVTVHCQQPSFGTIIRTCSQEGKWEKPIGKCSNCPKNSFSFYNATAQETQCKQCPSGTVFIRGNPLNPVKCYGKYYSEGGKTECSLCEGETRGSKEMGNIACKECKNGVIVGMNCVNSAVCVDGKWIAKVGSLLYSDCGQGMRGKKTRMCKYNSGPLGVWGAMNEEGCYDALPHVGFFKMEIGVHLQSIHSSALRKKYDDNKNIHHTPLIQLLQQTVQQSLSRIKNLTVQYVNYYDYRENTQFGTIIHFALEGKGMEGENMTDFVYSSLKRQLPDMTMSLKEQNAFLFHYYFIIKKVEVLWYDENKEYCEEEDGWPRTPLWGVAKKLCDSPLQEGYMTRVCHLEGNRVKWSAQNQTLCTIHPENVLYTLQIKFTSKKKRVYERKEFFEKLMEDVNCDRMEEMKLKMFLPSIVHGVDSFRSVFKDCRMKDDRLVISFLSALPPSLDLIEYMAKLSIVESITVVQEGHLLRTSYVLEFTSKALKTCPSQYLFCNQASILSGMYCHYRMYPIKQNRILLSS